MNAGMEIVGLAIAPSMTAGPAVFGVLAEAGPLLSLYVIALIVGGGLIFVSTVFGGHGDAGDVDLGGDLDLGGDVDFDLHGDVDVDGLGADVGVEGFGGDVHVGDMHVETGDMHVETGGDALDAHHGHAGSDLTLAQWFSIRFVVYFLAMFGLVGATLSWLTELPVWVVLGIAIVFGVVIGQMVHQTLRLVRKSGGNSQLTARDFVNRVGRVTAMVGGDQPGEVALSIRGGERYVSARTRHAEDRFGPGDSVGVIAFRGGVAEVVSKKEFEFLVDQACRNND